MIILVRLAGANTMLIGMWGVFAAFSGNELRAADFIVGVFGLLVGSVLLFFMSGGTDDRGLL